MGCAHSLDLRRRIIGAVAAGASAREAARRFAVSPSSAVKLVRRWRDTGSYAPRRIGGWKRRKLAGHEAWLHAVMAREPDITLAELQRRLADRGIAISVQAINTTLRALGYRYKKNRARDRAGACRRGGQAPAVADLAGVAEAGAPGLRR
jgi:putative transposase